MDREGILDSAAPDAVDRLGTWVAARLRRLLGWRPDRTTAGLILGGLLVYFAFLNLQSANQLLDVVLNRRPQISGVPVGLGTAALFSGYPTPIRALEAMTLTLGAGEAIAAAGCLLIAMGRGRALAVAGLGLAVLSRAGGLIVAAGERHTWQLLSDYAVDIAGLLLILYVVMQAATVTHRGPDGEAASVT